MFLAVDEQLESFHSKRRNNTEVGENDVYGDALLNIMLAICQNSMPNLMSTVYNRYIVNKNINIVR